MGKNNTTWTTRDGTKVLIKDMDDQHLTNAIKLCIRVALVTAGRDDAHWLKMMPEDLSMEWDMSIDELSPLSEHYPKGTQGLLKENSKRELFDVDEYISTKADIRMLACLHTLVKKS